MNRSLRAISICVLLGILGAGLLPFNPYPPKELSWLPNENGLHFGEFGTIRTSYPFQFAGSGGEVSCSLEVWLQPDVGKDQNTPLAFYTPENPLRFELRQYLDHLLLLHRIRDQDGRSRTSVRGVEHVFLREKQVLITITASLHRTAVYIDGRIAHRSPHFGLTRDDLAGQLVFGTSPVMSAPWHGSLLSLAVHEEELTETQVAQNYRRWTRGHRPASLATKDTFALYLFEEHTGDVVHSSGAWGQDLNIPRHFGILQKSVLFRPRKEDFVRLGFWKDVLLNVAGFLPFGFFVCAYLSSRRIKQAPFATILVSHG